MKSVTIIMVYRLNQTTMTVSSSQKLSAIWR